MALPRVVDGQTAGVSDYINSVAGGIDALSGACVVSRTSEGTAANATDTLLDWQSLDLDTIGGMWDPVTNAKAVTIRRAGTYSLYCQVRFDYDTTPVAPYSLGNRACKLMLNGTDVFTDTIVTDKKPTSVDGEGVTLTMSIDIRLDVDDQLFVSVWQDSGSSIHCADIGFGGTYLAVSYAGL